MPVLTNLLKTKWDWMDKLMSLYPPTKYQLRLVCWGWHAQCASDKLQWFNVLLPAVWKIHQKQFYQATLSLCILLLLLWVFPSICITTLSDICLPQEWHMPDIHNLVKSGETWWYFTWMQLFYFILIEARCGRGIYFGNVVIWCSNTCNTCMILQILSYAK